MYHLIKLLIILFFYFNTSLFAEQKEDFDSTRNFKFGYKFYYRAGQFDSFEKIISKSIYTSNFIFFKKNGNYIEVEPLNLFGQTLEKGKDIGDSIFYSSKSQRSYVPRVKFAYQVLQKKRIKIFLGFTHSLRHKIERQTIRLESDTYKDFINKRNQSKEENIDYSIGIDLNTHYYISKRFTVDFGISTQILKINIFNTSSYRNAFSETWFKSFNTFYEAESNPIMSTPVSIYVGLIYSFGKIKKM